MTAQAAGAGASVLGALGLLAFGLAPLPLAAAGCGAYVVAVVSRPWLAVPLIVLTLPFHLQPRAFLGIEMSAAEVAILLGAAAVLGRGVIERLRAAGKAGLWTRSPQPSPWGIRGGQPAVQLPAPSPVDWGVAAFLLAGFLSLLVTEYPRQSLRELRWLIVEPVLVFYIVRATMAGAAQAVIALWCIVTAGLVAAAAALLGLGAQGSLLDPFARAAFPYLSPNHLGLFLGRAGAVALAIALFWPKGGSLLSSDEGGSHAAYPSAQGRAAQGREDPERTRPNDRVPARALGWIALAMLLPALAKTISFGAWLGFGAAALAVAGLMGRRWAAAVAAGLAAAVVLALVVLPAERTTGRLDPASGTGLFRLQIWEASMRMLADHPVLGIGLDNYLYRYRGAYMLPEAWEEPDISHPHNWMLDFWLQLGALGLMAALALLGWSAVVAGRMLARRASPEDRLIGAAALGLLVDTLVHGAVDYSYFLVDAAVLWWITLGVLAARSSRIAPVTAIGTPL